MNIIKEFLKGVAELAMIVAMILAMVSVVNLQAEKPEDDGTYVYYMTVDGKELEVKAFRNPKTGKLLTATRSDGAVLDPLGNWIPHTGYHDERIGYERIESTMHVISPDGKYMGSVYGDGTVILDDGRTAGSYQ